MSVIGETTVGALIEKFGGSIKTGPFGTVLKAHEYTAEGVPLISVKEIGVGRFNIDATTPMVSPDITRRLPEYVLREGDLVFARKGAVDRSAMIDTAESGWFLGSDGIRLRPPAICNPRYIAYCFQNPRTQRWLLQHATGTTMASLNNKIIEAAPITIPRREVQDRIAETLSILDEKIELNRKQNRVLEAIAQTLFKRWFVEFEFPDENGRPYKSSGGAMQPSELGEVPVGWDGCLGDVLELAYGKALKQDIRVAGEFPVVGSSGVVGTHKEPLVNGGGIVVGRKGTVGNVIWLDTSFYPIDTTFYVVPKLTVNAWHFLYFLLKRQDFLLIGSDSAVPGLNRNHAYQNPIVIPPSGLLTQFEEVCEPLFAKIRKNRNEVRILANIRDTLLPKLMSGELRVGVPEESKAVAK